MRKCCERCDKSKIPYELRRFYDWKNDTSLFELCESCKDDSISCFSSKKVIDWKSLEEEYNSMAESNNKTIESYTNLMAGEFYNFYCSRKLVNHKCFLQGGKYYLYFQKAALMFWNREEFDPLLFINSLIESNNEIFPQQLATEKSWKIYLDHKDNLKKEISEGEVLATELISGYQALNGKSVKEFFEKKSNQLKLITSGFSFSIRYFCFSKSFREFYEDIESKMDKTINIDSLKVRVRGYPKLIEWMKKKLGDDFSE